jgi:hypothetical protein
MITLTELSTNRDKGMVPDRPLIIPMVPVPEECPLIQIKVDSTDLRAMFGLDIVIAHDSSRPERIIALTDAVVRAKPGELTLWNIVTGQFLSVVSMGRKFIAEVPPREDLQ